jgi:hypothetical protein
MNWRDLTPKFFASRQREISDQNFTEGNESSEGWFYGCFLKTFVLFVIFCSYCVLTGQFRLRIPTEGNVGKGEGISEVHSALRSLDGTPTPKFFASRQCPLKSILLIAIVRNDVVPLTRDLPSLGRITMRPTPKAFASRCSPFTGVPARRIRRRSKN